MTEKRKMIFQIFIFIICFLIALAAFLWSLSAMISVITGAPPIATPMDEIYWALKLAEPQIGETLLDLGCGDGRVLVVGTRSFGLRGIGYELAPWGNLITKLKIWDNDLKGKIKIQTKNILKANFEDADIIYLYLFPVMLKKLSGRFCKYLKPGSRIISYGFPIPGWKPDATVNSQHKPEIKIYLYKVHSR